MDKYDLSHLKELYLRSSSRGTVLASLFYSEEEFSETLLYLKKELGKSFLASNIHLLGGHQEADRQRMIFSSEEEIDEEEYVFALAIEPKNRNCPGFEHREVLGSIMGLGIKRGLIGDILIIPPKAYVFYAKEAEEMVLSLEKIGRENVEITPIEIKDVPQISNAETRSISIPSLRLDTLVAHVYNLSREQGKEAIAKGLVKVGQQFIYKNDYIPKEGERISLKGHGKFRYLGENGLTKKGKLSVQIEIYR